MRTKFEKCQTKWCRNRRVEKVTVYKRKDGTLGQSASHLRHCHKCRSRWFKERHPVTYVLNMLRHSAKKRNLAFTLTKEELTQLCAQTGYLEKRGNAPDSLTIDRIDWNEGYHIWNLKVATHEENSAQGADNRPRDERMEDAVDDDAVYKPPEGEGEPF